MCTSGAVHIASSFRQLEEHYQSFRQHHQTFRKYTDSCKSISEVPKNTIKHFTNALRSLQKFASWNSGSMHFHSTMTESSIRNSNSNKQQEKQPEALEIIFPCVSATANHTSDETFLIKGTKRIWYLGNSQSQIKLTNWIRRRENVNFGYLNFV